MLSWLIWAKLYWVTAKFRPNHCIIFLWTCLQVKRLYELCKAENSEDLVARVYPQFNRIFQRSVSSLSQFRTSNGLLLLVCFPFPHWLYFSYALYGRLCLIICVLFVYPTKYWSVFYNAFVIGDGHWERN